jgi:hypothetical protein
MALYFKDMERPTSQSIVPGKYINPDDPATPCGLIAKTFFNGMFLILCFNIIIILIFIIRYL